MHTIHGNQIGADFSDIDLDVPSGHICEEVAFDEEGAIVIPGKYEIREMKFLGPDGRYIEPADIVGSRVFGLSHELKAMLVWENEHIIRFLPRKWSKSEWLENNED